MNILKRFLMLFGNNDSDNVTVDKDKLVKPFNITEFNDWFKYEFTGYDGRVGAIGIFLRTDKLSNYWVEEYLKHLGQDTSYDNVKYHYDIVRKNWIEKLEKNDYTS